MDLFMAAAFFTFCFVALCQLKLDGRKAFAFITDDSDIKIAPENPSDAFRGSSENERETIDEFVRQRRIGNIALAHQLGEIFKDDLLICTDEEMKHISGVERGLCGRQLKILFSYAVNRAIGKNSPNSMVAHTAMSRFYDSVQLADVDSYNAINESGAFSMYLYVGRSEEGEAEAIGDVFAGLCGAQQSRELAEAGAAIYQRYFDACGRRIKEIGFKK